MDTAKESIKMVETWIHRFFLIMVTFIGFFLQDTLAQVRTQIKSNQDKIELLENILIELRTSAKKDAERYSDIKITLNKLDDKLEKLRP